jgi:hypothetical protein
MAARIFQQAAVTGLQSAFHEQMQLQPQQYIELIIALRDDVHLCRHAYAQLYERHIENRVRVGRLGKQ